MSRRASAPVADFEKLEDSLLDFWLAKVFPTGSTNAEGIRARAKRSGQKAMAIHAAALAANDKETAKLAIALAKQLVPYLSAKVIGEAFRNGVDGARRKPPQAPQTLAGD